MGKGEKVFLLLFPLATKCWNLSKATKYWNLPLATKHGNLSRATKHWNLPLATKHGNLSKATKHWNLPLATKHGNLSRATKHGNLSRAIKHWNFQGPSSIRTFHWPLNWDLPLSPSFSFSLKSKFRSFGVHFFEHNFLFEFGEYLFLQLSLGGEELLGLVDGGKKGE